MRRFLFLVILISSTNTFGQCSWKDMFPFDIGSSKFDVMRIVSTNSTIEQPPDKYGTARIKDGLKYYDYLKDSVYISYINLKVKGLECIIVDNENLFELVLSDDKLYKAQIEFQFSQSEYDVMMENYKKLQEVIPGIYKYEALYDLTDFETKEKIGEGIHFTMDSNEELEKPNYIEIGYSISYKDVYDKITKKWYKSNDIKNYNLKILIVDLRGSRLTGNGF